METGLIIVGSEILSGKRQDKHLGEVIALLAGRGMALSWARIIGDSQQAIREALVQSRSAEQLVFCCGGIGATPDDRTRQAAAEAHGVPLEAHPQAVALIEAEYGDRAYPNRVRMAEFPRGAGLIPNPVNRVAGFFVGHQHFVPGFPSMAWPMIEWVLDHRYPQLRNDSPPVEYLLRVVGHSAESDLLDIMETLLSRHPEIELSSLPSHGDAKRPRHIEFGVKGQPRAAAAAYALLQDLLLSRADTRIEHIRAPETGA